MGVGSLSKPRLRAQLRAARKAHVAGLGEEVRALVFHRPPTAVLGLIAPGVAIGLYDAVGGEAPALGYAKFFHERGHKLVLPWFADRAAPMQFRRWRDPYDAATLAAGPWGARQPASESEPLTPAVLFVPLVGFTADGHRLGQGGGHYDRWLAAHPTTTAIGLGWDCQLCAALPNEPHDRALDAVITPTRVYGEGA